MSTLAPRGRAGAFHRGRATKKLPISHESPTQAAATLTLWRRYQDGHTLAARNDLVVRYAPLVRAVASRVFAGLPNTVERDDLISFGTFGLIDAITKFDLSRKIKFETYATVRIKGSIIDELRSQDWVPRSVRSKAKSIDSAMEDLSIKFGRVPEDAELATFLGLTVADVWVLQSEGHVKQIGALDEHQGDDDRPSVSDSLFDIGSNPEDIYLVGEVDELLVAAVDSMGDRAKTILVLYYLEEMTLAQIGDCLGVTESRVCQLQGKLLQSLRGALVDGAVAG